MEAQQNQTSRSSKPQAQIFIRQQATDGTTAPLLDGNLASNVIDTQDTEQEASSVCVTETVGLSLYAIAGATLTLPISRISSTMVRKQLVLRSYVDSDWKQVRDVLCLFAHGLG